MVYHIFVLLFFVFFVCVKSADLYQHYNVTV